MIVLCFCDGSRQPLGILSALPFLACSGKLAGKVDTSLNRLPALDRVLVTSSLLPMLHRSLQAFFSVDRLLSAPSVVSEQI